MVGLGREATLVVYATLPYGRGIPPWHIPLYIHPGYTCILPVSISTAVHTVSRAVPDDEALGSTLRLIW